MIEPVVEKLSCTMPFKKHLPNYLRTHRKRLNLSQDQVALFLGRDSRTSISRYEHFCRIPDLKAAFALEIIHGKPARELFAGVYEEARKLVHGCATEALQNADPHVAILAQRILEPPGGRTAETINKN